MPATFTETEVVDMNKPKDWAYQLGLLDWDTTKIVMSKRQLFDFLATAGVSVDTNFTQIQKLPKFAKFGKITGEETSTTSTASTTTSPTPQTAPKKESIANVIAQGSDFKPTRRVRDVPGGATSIFFGEDTVEDEPPKIKEPEDLPVEDLQISPKAQTRTSPSSKTSHPGTTLGLNMFESGDGDAEEFKPTRRVRSNPGGEDHINDFF